MHRWWWGLGFAGLIGYSWLAGRTVYLKRVEVRLPDLPAALDGLTVGHMSDVHCDEFMTPKRLGSGIDLLMSARPDVIVLTGDLTTSTGPLLAMRSIFGQLRARLGCYAVLGNHEIWSGEPQVIQAALAAEGIRYLVNEGVSIGVGDSLLWVCGVDDVWAGHPHLRAALRHKPDGAYPLLLCHCPDFATRAAAAGIPLQLSGHSHGGQIAPFGLPLHLPPHGRRFPRGLQQVPGTATQVYTNLGFNSAPIPFRLGAPAEVAVLTLRRA